MGLHAPFTSMYVIMRTSTWSALSSVWSVVGLNPTYGSSFVLWKSYCLDCVVLLYLVVCMTLLASVFLLHLSLTCTMSCAVYMYVHVFPNN